MEKFNFFGVFLFAVLSPVLLHAQCGVAPANLGSDTTLCPGQSLVLNTGAPGIYNSFVWNDNSTAATKTVTTAGTYSVTANLLGTNIILNGDFELGNNNFSTGYVLGTGGAWGLLSNPGTYAITTSPNLAHNNFSSCADHTPAPGVNMMVVNGASTAGVNVWCQTVTVTPNTNYQLSAWASNALNENNVAQLQFSINSAAVGPLFTTSTTGCNWQQFFQVWNSGVNTTANICILNQNVGQGGNDFLLDDITFRPQCSSYDTVVVTYSTNPVVNLGPDQTVCQGTTVLLDAQNPGNTFLWSTGATTSTLSVNTGGTYAVTVTNPNFCSGTDQIVVNYEAQKNAGSDTNKTWCVTNGLQSLNTFLSSNATSGGTWWDNSGTIGANITTGGQLTLTNLVGSHQARYVVYGSQCPNDTSLFDFTVHDQPYGLNTTILDLCNTTGQSVDLVPYVLASTVVLSPFWVENSVNPSNQFNVSTGVLDVSNLSAGSYQFDYILPADSPCLADTSSVLVNITENPIIQFSSDVVKGCIPLSVNFTNTSIQGLNDIVTWNLGDGTVSNNPVSLAHTYQNVGCFDVDMTIVTSNLLCSASATIADMICVDPLPVADFKPDFTTVFSDDPTVNFTNLSQLNALNQWNFGDATGSNAIDPSHQFPLGEVGNYTVVLIVTSSEGCMDTTFQLIVVKDQLIFYVPNAFTPDADEFNSRFLPVLTTGFAPNSFHMEIFDRWGMLLFETSDLSSGWDGTFGNKPVPSGVYGWKIEFQDEKTDENYVKIGHVSVLR